MQGATTARTRKMRAMTHFILVQLEDGRRSAHEPIDFCGRFARRREPNTSSEVASAKTLHPLLPFARTTVQLQPPASVASRLRWPPSVVDPPAPLVPLVPVPPLVAAEPPDPVALVVPVAVVPPPLVPAVPLV